MLPLMVFSKFPIVQHPIQNILKYCFSNQFHFCVHPIFHYRRIPPYTFFLETLFPYPQINFFGKKYIPLA